MPKPKPFSMEHQALCIARAPFAIKRVAHNGMPDFKHVNPQLVASPSLGVEPHARGLGQAPDHLPIGDSGPPVRAVDFLPRTVGPVDSDRQVDCPSIVGDMAPNLRDIGLSNLPFLELKPKVALRMGGKGKHHDTRCVTIKPMNKQDLRKDRL